MNTKDDSTSYDVYFGRGGHTNQLRKKSWYRELLKKNYLEYAKLDVGKKRNFAFCRVVDVIAKRGGKFYKDSKSNSEDPHWEEVNQKSTVTVVMQALRDCSKETIIVASATTGSETSTATSKEMEAKRKESRVKKNKRKASSTTSEHETSNKKNFAIATKKKKIVETIRTNRQKQAKKKEKQRPPCLLPWQQPKNDNNVMTPVSPPNKYPSPMSTETEAKMVVNPKSNKTSDPSSWENPMRLLDEESLGSKTIETGFVVHNVVPEERAIHEDAATTCYQKKGGTVTIVQQQPCFLGGGAIVGATTLLPPPPPPSVTRAAAASPILYSDSADGHALNDHLENDSSIVIPLMHRIKRLEGLVCFLMKENETIRSSMIASGEEQSEIRFYEV